MQINYVDIINSAGSIDNYDILLFLYTIVMILLR